jgi:hypothetical protein
MYGDYASNVSAVAQEEVGSRREFWDSTFGWFEAVYVVNSDAVSFIPGDLLQFKASTLSIASAVKVTAAKLPKNQVLGVAQTTIPVGYFGWAVCRGPCLVAGDGSVTANSSLISDAVGAGRVKNATLTNADEVAAVVGYAQETDGVAGSLFRAYINL